MKETPERLKLSSRFSVTSSRLRGARCCPSEQQCPTELRSLGRSDLGLHSPVTRLLQTSQPAPDSTGPGLGDSQYWKMGRTSG